jgi:hypothetical protein
MVPRSPRPPDEKGVPRSGGEKSLDSQFKIVAKAFLESFELLEEYAPIWYTKQHHKRALKALRILQKSKATLSRQAVTLRKYFSPSRWPRGAAGIQSRSDKL